jgi:hypothetical protein
MSLSVYSAGWEQLKCGRQQSERQQSEDQRDKNLPLTNKIVSVIF